jgi:hypothetical protein
MKSKPLAFLPALSVAMAAHASAALVFSDDFSSDGTLVGSTPDLGGNWTQTGTVATNPITVASGSAALVASGQDVYAAFSESVPTTAGNSIVTTFDLTVSNVQSSGDYFLHLSDPVGTTSNFYGRIFARPSATVGFYQLGIASNSGTGTVTTYGTVDLALGQTIEVSMTWTFVAGPANDAFSLTTDGTSYLSGYTWTGNAEPATQVSAVNLRQGGSGTGPSLTVDNLEVSAIPEPAVALLGSLGLLGLLLRRRSNT